ncbi:hypothetical protein [Mesomycoplasma hyorhinis]|uniref:DUF1934 domain-containing protein n=3 Tax=Mesomycoplasma hyorhinis TaxID=2100 RepID=A0AAJ3D6J6_MESHY|nr:hypothetical protein [Mesomycoplasma hyorhinis]AEC45625.1 hypothetical protein SRH_00280 [Mesomycoplasma hyorhinis MCLD]AEX14038.1 hypothetical protein MYM_0257 [Mesomycoplasma hyorhinis GDL-1]AFX74286.1 hypothetical protein MOS_361 [Mesomycoplasma hyorhinis SK76]AHA41028.1 hypothetical protein Q453_0286 [Mesomycoplasma hyorhinis DBS 1050]TRM75873.1 hypothetical protein DJ532_09015 [Sulfolobus sp. A20-N-F8]TRM84337.1 hypothetical protein DJ531_00795 [Sulfolobus sp. A20-N-F6]CRH24690.1 Unc
MRVKFSSLIKSPQSEDQKIAFESKLEKEEEISIDTQEPFTSYTFTNPENKGVLRIEIYNNKALLITEFSTIVLDKEQKHTIEYNTTYGQMFLESSLQLLSKTENEVNIHYSLYTLKGELVGQYFVVLEIEN